jgi:hypothetical protein
VFEEGGWCAKSDLKLGRCIGDMGRSEVLESARALSDAAFQSCRPVDAVFYARKAVAASRRSPEDMLRLCRALVVSGQRSQCVDIVLKYALESCTEESPLPLPLANVAAQCLVSTGQWDTLLSEPLLLLHPEDPAAIDAIRARVMNSEEDDEVISAAANLCCCRAKAYQMMENQDSAEKWYKFAYDVSPYSAEALLALQDMGLDLSSISETSALDSFVMEESFESSSSQGAISARSSILARGTAFGRSRRGLGLGNSRRKFERKESQGERESPTRESRNPTKCGSRSSLNHGWVNEYFTGNAGDSSSRMDIAGQDEDSDSLSSILEDDPDFKAMAARTLFMSQRYVQAKRVTSEYALPFSVVVPEIFDQNSRKGWNSRCGPLHSYFHFSSNGCKE